MADCGREPRHGGGSPAAPRRESSPASRTAQSRTAAAQRSSSRVERSVSAGTPSARRKG